MTSLATCRFLVSVELLLRAEPHDERSWIAHDEQERDQVHLAFPELLSDIDELEVGNVCVIICDLPRKVEVRLFEDTNLLPLFQDPLVGLSRGMCEVYAKNSYVDQTEERGGHEDCRRDNQSDADHLAVQCKPVEGGPMAHQSVRQELSGDLFVLVFLQDIQLGCLQKLFPLFLFQLLLLCFYR
jgi:hypothetical protein